MSHFKNRLLLELYNHRSKNNYYNNLKTADFADARVEKRKPIDFPPSVPAKKEQVKEIASLSDSNRPGDVDPYYRMIPPSVPKGKDDAKSKPLEPINEIRPGDVDPYYAIPPSLSPYNSVSFDRPGTFLSNSNYRGETITPPRNTTLAERALKGRPLSDAEGLQRASEAPEGIYVYGDTIYAAGTRGSFFDKEWQQNMEYIAKPIAKGLVFNHIDKLTALGSFLAPEFAPEISLLGGSLTLGKATAGEQTKDETKVKIQEIDRYKSAIKAMDANPQIKKAVGFSVGGMTVLELKNKYQDLTGNVYGTPYADPLAKETIKEQLNTEREIRNKQYGDSILAQPAKFVDNKMQDLAEFSLGLSDVKTMSDTGIKRFRQAGDILTSLDNSAITTVNKENLLNPIKAHSYEEQASQNFTADQSKAFGRVNPDNSVSIIQ